MASVSRVFIVILCTIIAQLTVSDSPPYCDEGYPIIIVGSGLAGHSAAAELISILSSQNKLKSHPIIMFEKEPKFGGNSMKATSGINGANTEFQTESEINDNTNAFAKDTYYSAMGGKSNIDKKQESQDMNVLITTLTSSSGSAVNWLKNEFDLQLTAISQCGGHSNPRTHRVPAGPVGNIIVKTVHKKIEDQLRFFFYFIFCI